MAGRLIAAPRRPFVLALLAAATFAVHVQVLRALQDDIAAWSEPGEAPPQKFKVAFVRELQPQAPPVAAPGTAPAARPPRPRPAAPRPEPPASAPRVPAATSAEAPPAVSPPEPSPAIAAAPPSEAATSLQDHAASAPPPADAGPDRGTAAASAPDWPSAWPASTRLTYTLTGWYRGEVHGQARVEWLRDGPRYQVHLEVEVGPSFAPLMVRRMASEGVLTPEGLAPSRYDEETRIGLAEPRRLTMRFEPDGIVMANGQRRERWPGVQDTASQFVQIIWLFATQPQRLAKGSTFELPLALPRNIDRWEFDVLEADTLRTRFAELPVVHLKPRRLTRPRGDLVVETWFAPTLQYLPARIRIHQDAETFVDLLLDRPPLQAER